MCSIGIVPKWKKLLNEMVEWDRSPADFPSHGGQHFEHCGEVVGLPKDILVATSGELTALYQAQARAGGVQVVFEIVLNLTW